jgi:stearoyl-CoA desaturase (delta-9 desaturase)
MATPQPKIWWPNVIFFVGTHLCALTGAYYVPTHALPRPTIWLTFASWQLSCFGWASVSVCVTASIQLTIGSITIGYHRLYTHRSFRASLGLRILLAALGTAAHQGSIRVNTFLSITYTQAEI